MPDSPYPILYRTVNFYKVAADIEKAKEDLKDDFTANETQDQSLFGIASLPSKEGIYGIRQLLELLDPLNIIMLRKRISQCTFDIENEVKDVKFDVTHALAGGYMMKSLLCKNPESSPEPLWIYSIFKASSSNFESAYDIFFDYIHEDIKAMTRIDLDFNIFQKLILQYRDKDERIHQRKFILEEILNNKQRMHSEIMNSVKNRHLIATQVLMRVIDLEFSGTKAHRYASRSGVSGFHGSITDEDAYEYIPVKKVYIFHLIEKKSKEEINYISYSQSSLCALVEGVFNSREAAESYASFYMRKTEEIDKKKLSDYLENKYSIVFNDYYNNELIKSLWGVLSMVLLEADTVRFQILENVFAILSHKISELLNLRSISKTIEVLIIANQNYGLSQFKSAIIHMFAKFQKQFHDILSTGFAPEILAIRKYINLLLTAISGDSRKELDIDIQALNAFRNISKILKTVWNSIGTQIVDQIRVTKSSIDIVLNIMRQNTDIQIITQREFIEKKKPDKVVVVKDEMDRALKAKRYPAKWNKEHVHMQYVCDTYSFESLYFLLRDLIINPLYPNILALCEYKLQGHNIRFDIYGGISDELIIETDFNKPYKNPEPPTNMFIVGDNEMKEKGIPFSISDYHTLFAWSAQDIGLFRKFFKNFEWANALSPFYEEMNFQTLISVTGYSIFNRYKRLKKQTPNWSTWYDFIFTGIEYDRAMDNFTKLLIHYAAFLHKESECIVNGFYSDSDPDSPALTVYKIRTNDEVINAADKLYEYFNNRIVLYLRILAPVENTFKLIKIYFNMHFRVQEDTQYTTLIPLTTVNDVVKVFFTLGEFTVWDQILKSQHSYLPTDLLFEEYKSEYINFRLQDALKCRILLQILDENIDNINHYMRLLYSPSETMYNISESVHIVYELLSDFAQLESN